MTVKQITFGKTAKRGVVWSFLREGVTELVMFPASMVAARLLTPREFGIAAAAMFFVLLSNRLAELGFNVAIVRTKTLRPEHLSTVFVINIVVGGLMYLALLGLAPLVGRFYETPEAGEVLPVAALSFLIAPLGTISAAMLSRDLRFRESAMVDWYQSLAFAASSVLLAWLGFSYMSMVYARVLAVAVQTVSRLIYAPWKPRLTFSAAALREIFAFGAGVHAKRLLEYTAQNIDNLVVGRFLGMTALGLYDKAFSTMWRVLARMNTDGPAVMFRIFSIIHEEPQRFRRAYIKVVMSASLLGVPVFTALAVMATPLMSALFGAQWLGAAVPFQLLCLVGCLKLINTYVSSAIQATGWIWSEVWRQFAYATLIVVGVLAFRQQGPVGATLGVLLATCVMTILMHALLLRVTPLTPGDVGVALVPALLCSVVTGTAVLATGYGLQTLAGAQSAWLLVGAQGLTALVTYVACVLFVPHRALRTLVHEVADDLAPAAVKRHPLVQWYLGTDAPTGASAPT